MPPNFPNAIHAAQLALALAPRRLALALGTADGKPAVGSLLALARAAEWFARETGVAVAVLLPACVAGHGELDSVNWSAVTLPEPVRQEDRDDEKSRLLIRPFVDRPHPNSLGEQLLAKRLESDAELAGLFRYNQTVVTCLGSRFLVDLLWDAGRIVVEVDGYRGHSDLQAFAADRQRDYELLISGYFVLRLPHDEIVRDVELAVAKIRDVVAFRRESSLLQGEGA